MSTLDTMVESLLHSPRLPEVLGLLQRQWKEEQQHRQRFYTEMTPEQKIEFIDGKVVLHSPARKRHLDVTGRLMTLLRTFVSIHKLGSVAVEKCLCVFPRNDYEPDIVFFGPEKAAQLQPDTLKFPIPDFVVEVLSNSTKDRDRGIKFEDYAANGVGEYWIVNAEDSVIEQYVLQSGSYELRLKSNSGTLQSEVIKSFEIEVQALFDEEANLTALREMMG